MKKQTVTLYILNLDRNVDSDRVCLVKRLDLFGTNCWIIECMTNRNPLVLMGNIWQLLNGRINLQDLTKWKLEMVLCLLV